MNSIDIVLDDGGVGEDGSLDQLAPRRAQGPGVLPRGDDHRGAGRLGEGGTEDVHDAGRGGGHQEVQGAGLQQLRLHFR